MTDQGTELTFDEYLENTPEGIHTFAVDADIVAYRCAAVNEDEEVEEVYSTIDEYFFNITRMTGIGKMTMFLSDIINFRYRVAKTRPYKGNRIKCVCMDKDKSCMYYETPECKHIFNMKECEFFKDVFQRPKHILAAKEYLLKQYKGIIVKDYEADDCIASYMTEHSGVAHAGMDKDIKQIVGWHYDFVKYTWEYTNLNDSILKLYRQVCSGDSTDNIPGLPGIGAKKAEKAIQVSKTAERDCKAMYSSMTGKDWEKYYDEQFELIAMKDTLKIPYDCVTVDPPPVFEEVEEEGGFIGVDEEPKRNIFSNSRESANA